MQKYATVIKTVNSENLKDYRHIVNIQINLANTYFCYALKVKKI